MLFKDILLPALLDTVYMVSSIHNFCNDFRVYFSSSIDYK